MNFIGTEKQRFATGRAALPVSRWMVRFSSLPADARARFTAAVLAPRESPSSPIARESIGRWRARITMVVLCLLGLCMAAIVAVTASTLESAQYLVWSLLLLPLILIGATIYSRLKHQNPFGATPFPPGRYLFAFDYVDARGTSIIVRPYSSLRAVHNHVNGRYITTDLVIELDDGTKDGFQFSERVEYDWAMNKLQGVQATARQAAHHGDLTTVASLDPFFGVRRS